MLTLDLAKSALSNLIDDFVLAKFRGRVGLERYVARHVDCAVDGDDGDDEGGEGGEEDDKRGTDSQAKDRPAGERHCHPSPPYDVYFTRMHLSSANALIWFSTLRVSCL